MEPSSFVPYLRRRSPHAMSNKAIATPVTQNVMAMA
jgi:hypothetical protein